MFSFFSNIFLESQNPCLVLPNELGPEEVGVSRPMFLIRIRHSAGISSGSSSLSDPAKAFATGFSSFGGSFLGAVPSFIWMAIGLGFCRLKLVAAVLAFEAGFWKLNPIFGLTEDVGGDGGAGAVLDCEPCKR